MNRPIAIKKSKPFYENGEWWVYVTYHNPSTLPCGNGVPDEIVKERAIFHGGTK